jgi:hypothetical protein
MSHVRQQIREYFEAQLAGLDTTGANVYASRVYPLTNSTLPALLIYTQSESLEEHAFSKQRVQNRDLDVIVEGYVRALANFDDALDNICKEAEVAILDDPSLGGLAIDCNLTQVEANYSGEGEQPVATIRLTFTVQYRTETGQPETAI